MFGQLGAPELILIAAATLLVFGPKRLPELAKGLGRGIRDFKKALEGGVEEPDEKAKLTSKTEAPSAPHTVARDTSPLKEPS